jgi:hypothetical protein
VDDTFVVALTNAGHHVTAYWLNDSNISDKDLDRINTNDLVIVSYSVNSGPMNMGNAANTSAPANSERTGRKWNTLVTAPLILTKANLARAGSGRLNWFTDMSSNDWFTAAVNAQPTPSDFDSANNLSTTASGKLTFVEPGNPLFAGIVYTNNGTARVMSNYFTVDISQDLSNPDLKNYFIPGIPFPLYNRGNTLATLSVIQDGVDLNYANDLSPGGRILATMDFNPFDPGLDIPPGTAPTVYPNWVVTGIAIAEWPLGSKAWRHCADGTEDTDPFCDVLGGYRMFFAAGTRDPAGTVKADGFLACGYDLTADGERIFLRAVDRAILQGENPALLVSARGGDVVVSWNAAVRTWKLQSSPDLSAWSDVASGVANNTYAVPPGAPAAQFFRLVVN